MLGSLESGTLSVAGDSTLMVQLQQVVQLQEIFHRQELFQTVLKIYLQQEY